MNAAATRSEPANRLTGIEAGRGIAASLVVLYHVARHLDKAYGAPLLKAAFQFGHSGVDFFFVISGFIILFVHYGDVGDPTRLSRYAGRRFTRLMPNYWIALALTVAIILAGSRAVPSLAQLVLSASLLPSNQDMILGIAWTLRYEFLFYVLFAILIVHRQAGLFVMAIWFLLTLAAVAGFDMSWLVAQFSSAFNIEFFFGMLAAYALRNYVIPRPVLMLTAGIVLFSAAAAMEDVRLLDGFQDIGRFAYGITSTLIVLGTAEADRQKQRRMPAGMRHLGMASYSVYLYQFVFIGIAWQILLLLGAGQWLPLAAQFGVLAIAGIGGGVLMSNLVEYPVMRLVRGQRAVARVQARRGMTTAVQQAAMPAAARARTRYAAAVSAGPFLLCITELARRRQRGPSASM